MHETQHEEIALGTVVHVRFEVRIEEQVRVLGETE
jgi:hypothetical protein